MSKKSRLSGSVNGAMAQSSITRTSIRAMPANKLSAWSRFKLRNSAGARFGNTVYPSRHAFCTRAEAM
jgi:hypothetical protein